MNLRAKAYLHGGVQAGAFERACSERKRKTVPFDPATAASGGACGLTLLRGTYNGDMSDAQPLKKCLPEHCFHAFDALYCALTHARPIAPVFPNDEWWVVAR